MGRRILRETANRQGPRSTSASSSTERYFGQGYYQVYQRYLLPREQSQAEADFLLKELRPWPGQRWLDLPCGYGRHLLQLKAWRPDLNLAGGDLNLQYLREPGLREAAAVAACDMRRLPFASGVFHGVLNLLNSFGYYPPALRRGGKGADKALDDRAVLGEWARVLRPGGRLVMDLANRRALVGLVNRQPMIRYCGGEYEVIETFMWDARREVLRNETLWRWPSGEEQASYTLRLYTPKQIEKMLARAGFRIESVYGDFSGDSFHPATSERMLVIARL